MLDFSFKANAYRLIGMFLENISRIMSFLIERIFISRLAIQLYCVSNHLMRFGHKIEEKNTNKWNKNNKL